MRRRLAHALIVSLAGLWLAGCSTSQDFSNLLGGKSTSSFAATDESGQDALASASSLESEKGLLGGDPYDALSRGKRHYRLGSYGLAEQHFRKAVESHPRDAEAWLGLAASYDQLRRFDLADRAYAQAIRIVGPTVEILNNQGYSYMLRGDYKRARATLLKAKRKDPKNKYVANNLRLLNRSARLGKAVE